MVSQLGTPDLYFISFLRNHSATPVIAASLNYDEALAQLRRHGPEAFSIHRLCVSHMHL